MGIKANNAVQKGFMGKLIDTLNPAGAIKKTLNNKADNIEKVAKEVLENGNMSDDSVKLLRGKNQADVLEKYGKMDVNTAPPSDDGLRRNLINGRMNAYADNLRESGGSKALWQEEGVRGLGSAVKNYYKSGDMKTNLIRGGVTYAGLVGAGTIGRYMGGGSIVTNTKGERDIAGIPFI